MREVNREYCKLRERLKDKTDRHGERAWGGGGGGGGGRNNIIVRWILDFNCINCILLDLYWKAKAFVRNYKRKFQKINGNGDPQFKATGRFRFG